MSKTGLLGGLRATHLLPSLLSPSTRTCGRHCMSAVAPGSTREQGLQSILPLFRGCLGKARNVTQSHPLRNMLVTDLLENTDDVFTEREPSPVECFQRDVPEVSVAYGKQI